jgi:hypothetical protein
VHPSSPPGQISPTRCELLARLEEVRKYLKWSFVTLTERTSCGSKTSWHRWFRGKEEISEYLVQRAVNAMMTELDSIAKTPINDNYSLQGVAKMQESLQLVLKLWKSVQTEKDATSKSGDKSSRARPLLSDETLADAAERLAEEVEKQWIREADERRLRLPGPIPVQWCWAHGVTSKMTVVANDPPRRSPVFSTLPGVATATPESLQAGGLRELFDVYGGVDSGRVVILGDSGTGKSASAILTLLEALKHRGALDQTQRTAVPVPVLLTTHGWDPRTHRLGQWLAARLAKDYPFLQSRRYGRDAVTRLVEAGAVTLFLDGLDEMDSDLYRDALADISKHTTLRLVVLTRSKEFATAVSTSRQPVHAAAALELLPVSADEAATYLENYQLETDSTPWERLGTHLREQPGSVLSCALGSPLNLTLLRDLDQPAVIDELLSSDRFHSPEEIENELLDRFISSDEDRLALGYIATRMNEQESPRDLAWWQISRWASRKSRITRISVTVLLGILTGALVGAVTFGPLGQYTVRGTTGALFGAVYLSGIGFGFGLVTGLISEFRQPRSPRQVIPRYLRSESFSPFVGLLVGFATGLAVGNQSHWAFGFLAGLLATGVAGLATAGVKPGPRETRQTWWTTAWSRVHLPSGVVTGLPIGLAYGLTTGPAHGLIAGIVGAVAFGLIVGFSQPSADVAADPYTSWRHDCKRGILFGLTTGLAIGLPLGIKNGTAHGPLAGLVAGIGFTIIIALGCTIGASHAWRATLLFLQLRRHGIPMRGMKFLEAARKRGVLRTVGPLYQFKHPNLQDRLATMYQRSFPADPGRRPS